MSTSNITVDGPTLEDDLKARLGTYPDLDPMQRALLTGGALEVLDRVPGNDRLRQSDDWAARQGDIVTLVERVVGTSTPRDPTRAQIEREIIASIEGARRSVAAAPEPATVGAGPAMTSPHGARRPGNGGSQDGLSGGRPGDDPPQKEPLAVKLVRSAPPTDANRALWNGIQIVSSRLAFDQYSEYIDAVFNLASLEPGDELTDEAYRARKSFKNVFGADAYRILKLATDSFIINRCGLVRSDELDEFLGPTGNVLPYLHRIQKTLREFELREQGDQPQSDAPCHREVLRVFDSASGIIQERLTKPCLIELIWAYWMEEAGLVQSMKAISLRFQNKRSPALRNSLERIALDPLRPMNNLLWGFIEDESHQLSLSRRAYEYDHHYGLSIEGRAVEPLASIDSRRGFVQAFHTLLSMTAAFYKELDDNTISQDGFPLLNGLKEVHLILAQGMHNQWGDLPSQTRSEMLIQQWLLARPEMREFLGGRVMVPYEELWMGRVETMRQLQGWGTKPINHFRDLAVFGEQLLLSIRFVDWIGIKKGDVAADWAVFWRNEVQTYIHAYRSLTGVDLTADAIDHRPPSALLRQRA